VSHDFTLAGAASPSGTTLNVGGNFTNNSTGTLSVTNVNLNGTTAQTLGGTTATTFTNLAVNNAAGVTLTNGATVNGTLDLTSGLITTGSNTITVGCSGDINYPSYPTATSYINGKLARIYCAVGSKDFPIGKGGNYRPLTLNYTALTGTPSTVTVEQIESTLPGSLPANTYVQQDRHWTITESGSSSRTYTLTLNGSPFTPGNGEAKILQGNGTTNTGLTASFVSPNFTSTGITTFNNFAVGAECTAPIIETQPISASSCEGVGSPSFTVSATGLGLSYQWQESITGTEGTFNDITNGGVYSNATTATLNITNPLITMNGYAYHAVVCRDCGSSATTNAVTLTVALPTITLLESVNPVCSGINTANLPYSATTGSPNQYRIDYDTDAENAGFTDISYTSLVSSPISLTVPSTPGTYNGTIYVKNTGTTCESIAYPFTITINPLPQGSLIGNTICSGGTGQLTWTATSGTGPFTVVYNDGVADRTVFDIYSGVPFNVYTNPSTTTNYSLVSVQGAYCTRSAGFEGANATITVTSSAYWSGNIDSDWDTPGNWSCGGVPTSSIDAYIPLVVNQPTIHSTGAACNNLTIDNSAILTISAAGTLTVNGTTTNNGTLTVDADGTNSSNSGSFIDNGTITGTGTCKFKKYFAGDGRWRYIGSPVHNTSGGILAGTVFDNLSATASTGDRLLFRNEYNNTWGSVLATDKLEPPLRGYTFQSYDTPAAQLAEFAGVFNTGDYSITNLTRTETIHNYKGYNLVTNPYPSAIRLGTYANHPGVTMTNLRGTVWVRDIGPYLSDNYATYNWYTAIWANASATQDLNSSEIPAMQAFWVRVKTAGTGTFELTNACRVHSSMSFYKTTPSNNIFRLKVSSNNLTDETVIYFNDSAQSTFENYDSEKWFSSNNNTPQIYTLTTDNSQVIINGFPVLGMDENRVVPLGFMTNVGGAFQLTATNINDFDPNIPVYLEDISLGEMQDLRENACYSFTSCVVNTTSRFRLHYGVTITGINQQFHESNAIYSIGNNIYINTSAVNCQIELYDMLGKKIMSRQSEKGLNIINTDVETGIYLVKVFSGDSVKTEKVLIYNNN